MKKVLLLFFLTLICFSASSQESKFIYKNKEFILDSRVEDYLGQAEANKFKEKGAYKLMQLNYLVNNSFKLIPSLPKKDITVSTYQISTTDINKFNILKEGIELTDKNQYFNFGTQYLIVYSQNSYNYSFKKYIQSLDKN